MKHRVLGVLMMVAGWLIAISCLYVGAVVYDIAESALVGLGREAAVRGAIGGNATDSLAGGTAIMVSISCLAAGAALVFVGWDVANKESNQ